MSQRSFHGAHQSIQQKVFIVERAEKEMVSHFVFQFERGQKRKNWCSVLGRSADFSVLTLLLAVPFQLIVLSVNPQGVTGYKLGQVWLGTQGQLSLMSLVTF